MRHYLNWIYLGSRGLLKDWELFRDEGSLRTVIAILNGGNKLPYEGRVYRRWVDQRDFLMFKAYVNHCGTVDNIAHRVHILVGMDKVQLVEYIAVPTNGFEILFKEVLHSGAVVNVH